MRSLLFTIVFIASLVVSAAAQQLYIPRNVARAYAAGTRSPDGKPGPKYWQNKGVYNISLSVAPPSRTVTGTEEITYTNNSPDTLNELAIRLELNSHQPEAPREQPISTDYLTSGVHIDAYSENGKAKEWDEKANEKLRGMTWFMAKLETPLKPAQSVKLAIKWHYDLSVKSSREGMIDPSTAFIAYFYPRVAVYDDTDGWDTAFFVEGHEFYNDFNDYTFQVTAPKNFIVWATGDLLNPDEVLKPEFAARLKSSFNSDDVIHVATLKELTDKVVTQQTDTLTWKWKADNVSDVAIGVSDHYIWDAGSVVVDRTNNRRASVQAAYDEPSKDFTKMVGYGKHALDWCSNNFPGVPYPYQKTTIFRGFADMEYPMMVNDSSNPNDDFTRFVAEHEILHTWFPFYMGINEQRYGFMDEGWTTAFENMIGTDDLGQARADQLFKGFRVQGWIENPAADADLPIINPGDAATGQGFGNSEYGKAALGYIAIKDMVGDAEFQRMLRGFIDDWHGKHTLPWDMFNDFNRISGKDMNWFFKNWFFDNGYIDIAVTGVAQTDGGYNVGIKNVGGKAAPTNVIVTYTDGTTETLHQTAGIWQANQSNTSVKVPTSKTVKSVTLDGGIYMDANPADDKWEAK
ncbi:MAG: M1 family metallopeptidase [Pyrinomonadaceae bacterium]